MDNTLIDSALLVSLLGHVVERSCWLLEDTKMILALATNVIWNGTGLGFQWGPILRVEDLCGPGEGVRVSWQHKFSL